MGQNDASAGLQLRSISALEVQGGDGVVADLGNGNAAEGLEVGLVHNGNEELGSVCICEVVAADINLFDIQKVARKTREKPQKPTKRSG